jgi:DNA modification methylase
MATLSDLKQDHKNARKRTETSASLLKESLQRYGPARSIVIDEDDRILAGNGTVEAALDLGIEGLRVIDANPDEIIAVRRTGLTEDQKVGLALADNRAADLAEWDAEMLHRLSEEHDIAPWFEDDDVEALLEQVEQLEPEEGNTDPDEAPEPPEEPITKPGDLWILGNHRLLCGDSTNIQHVERLMDGRKADMVFTDPPYGMNLDTDYSKMGDGGKTHKAVIADDEQYDAGFLLSTFAYCKEIFLWGADYYVETLRRTYPNLGSWIVWDKYSDEQRHGLLDGRFGSAFETCWSKTQHKRELARVLVTTNYTARGDETRVHPTQKPVALAEWFFDRWGKSGDLVVDLYGGSGTTLIACEKTSRHCRMMELDPAYCDVIVKRWEDFTGNTAVCVPSETHFDEPEDDI